MRAFGLALDPDLDCSPQPKQLPPQRYVTRLASPHLTTQHVTAAPSHAVLLAGAHRVWLLPVVSSC